MPVYVGRCLTCGHLEEEFFRSSEEFDQTRCPMCGGNRNRVPQRMVAIDPYKTAGPDEEESDYHHNKEIESLAASGKLDDHNGYSVPRGYPREKRPKIPKKFH